MPGGLLWGWDDTNKVWVKLQVDANGFVKVDMPDVTRELFLPANAGWIEYGSSAGFGPRYAAVKGSANAWEPGVSFAFKVPDDFVSFSSLKAVWGSLAASGNMYWVLKAYYAAAGEVYNTHADDPVKGVTATGGNGIINVQEPANPLTLASLAKGDYLGVYFDREGSSGSDTLNSDMWLLGLLFTYVAKQ